MLRSGSERARALTLFAFLSILLKLQNFCLLPDPMVVS